MPLKDIFVFFGVVIALNLLLTAATGRVYDFWQGRRGGGKAVATVTSPPIRLALACAGVILLGIVLLYRRINHADSFSLFP
jgi:hypothetical protein